jgi:hypothetical protein
MTRAEGIFGVWDLSRGSLSRAGLMGKRATAPPIDEGVCDAAVPDVRGFGGVAVEAGGSTDEVSRLMLEVVDADIVLGRGGGAIGGCCVRDGTRVTDPTAAPAGNAVARGKFALLAVAVAVGVFAPPD